MFTCHKLNIIEVASVFQTGRPVLTVMDAYSILTMWTGLPRGSDLHPIRWHEQDQSVMSCRDSSLTEGKSVVCIVAHMSFVYPKADVLSDDHYELNRKWKVNICIFFCNIQQLVCRNHVIRVASENISHGIRCWYGCTFPVFFSEVCKISNISVTFYTRH